MQSTKTEAQPGHGCHRFAFFGNGVKLARAVRRATVTTVVLALFAVKHSLVSKPVVARAFIIFGEP